MSTLDIIAAAALDAFPAEACGLILLSGIVVHTANVAADPLTGFVVDPVWAEYWWGTGLVTAVWHSHPQAGSLPSAEDEQLAVPGLESWIWSVPDEELAVYAPDEAGRLQLVRLDMG